MSTPEEEEANMGKVLTFLREWDRGDSRVRGRMLTAFLSRNPGRRLCDVELQLAQVSSLFLARITTWTRLTYPLSVYLLYVQAACGRLHEPTQTISNILFTIYQSINQSCVQTVTSPETNDTFVLLG